MKLAECYMKGEGVEKNEEEALAWFRKAAELKSKGSAATDATPSPTSDAAPTTMASAQSPTPAPVAPPPAGTPQTTPAKKGGRRKLWVAVAAGIVVMLGGGVGAYYVLREDPYVAYQRLTKEGKESEAMERLREAAEDGNAEAQCNLGLCYANGEGVSKDMAEAVKWYRKAAEQGNAMAQCKLGECYEDGEGVGKDATEAVKWFRLAAEQGNADVQINLDIRKAKQIQTELKEKDVILVLPEEVKRAEKVVMEYWKKELFADDKEGSGKGAGTDGYHPFDIRFRRYAQAFYWDVFEDMHCFSWLSVPKEYVSPYLDAGKGLLNEFIMRADKEAGQLTFSPYEIQTSFRLALLQYAIDICQLRVDESTSCSKLYSGQTQLRLHLAEKSYSNYVTALRNLYKSASDRDEKEEKEQKH